MTSLDPALASLAGPLPDDPVSICAAVQGLVIQPHDAAAAGLPEHRIAEKNIRPAGELVKVLAALDSAPLARARPPARRVVGTCRHYAVLSCALLQCRGIPARVRCGFATYFVPGHYVDHWITEYQESDAGPWVRIDSEILGGSLVPHPDDLAPGEFLTGGEAWTWFRSGSVDGQLFGVVGTGHAWGPAEIRGNAIRDLAALCQREMLPWDEWGRMTASYAGQTGSGYDDLIDQIAATCAGGDPAALTGKVEEGEPLAAALVREMREETGLEVEPGRLLYVCDHLPSNGSHVLHLTFEALRVGGSLGDVAVGLDSRPIRSVEFVSLADLPALGFGPRFVDLAIAGFPGAGSYMGPKSSIGL
jgi:hypothetical protein